MLQALRFDPSLLRSHFSRHKKDFGVVSEAEYEALAVAFIQKPLSNSSEACGYCPNCSCVVYGKVHECMNKGDLIRYDTVTEELGILGSNGFIRTYFRPDPEWNKVSNIKYYHDRCKP